MDLTTLGIAMGSAWLSGINLYATVVTLGLLQRFGYAHLPGDLEMLAHPWVLITAGVLFAVQFIADKVPGVDSVWDMVHTFIRNPAGAILAAAAFAHLDPKIRLLAFVIGGGIALTSHGTKTASRLAVNTSPEPVSNWILSIVGDVLSIGASVLMTIHPAVLVVLVSVATVLSFLFLRWIWRALHRLFARGRVTANDAAVAP
jgi:uncharacterized membrane protein HdeD (DUF308 family)